MAERGLSQRRACRLVQIDPKTVRRRARGGDEAVRARLRALAFERRRFGYRRLGTLLECEGKIMNRKKLTGCTARRAWQCAAAAAASGRPARERQPPVVARN